MGSRINRLLDQHRVSRIHQCHNSLRSETNDTHFVNLHTPPGSVPPPHEEKEDLE